jgi:hypothetical protein
MVPVSLSLSLSLFYKAYVLISRSLAIHHTKYPFSRFKCILFYELCVCVCVCVRE